jgi:hypothetical protein
MKNKFLIIVITILFSSFSNDNKSNISSINSKEYVLLIRYERSVDFEVIKDYKRMKKRYFYVCTQPLSGESYYDYSKKVFYSEEFLKLNDSSKIIFWDEDKIEVKDITLPYNTSLINIDNLSNDSTFQFTLNNKKHLLAPGQIFCDTLVKFEREKKRVYKITEFVEVRNYGLILKTNIIDIKESNRRAIEEGRIRDSIDIYDLNLLEKKK